MRVTLLLVAAGVFGGADAAFAHALAITATAGDGVRVEAGYDDGTPADGATVTLTGPGGAVGTATTDVRGVATLPRPPAGDYTVTVDDGAGHRGSVSLTVPASPAELSTASSGRRNKWAMGGAGLAVIAAGTLLLRRRKRSAEPACRETNAPTLPSG